MGRIKFLPLDKSIESQNLRDNSTLVLMGLQALEFDPNCKDEGVEVSEMTRVL